MKSKIESKNDSTRITFRVRKECSENIVWLANHLGITQKEVFNKITGKYFAEEKWGGIVAKLVSEVAKSSRDNDKVRKAQVVSSNAHRLLNSLSRAYGVSRDDLIEVLVLLLKTTLAVAIENNRDKHTEAQKIIGDFEKQVGQIEDQLGDLLGEDDPIYARFRFVGTILMNLSMAIDAEIKRGTPVDPDDMAQQG